MIRTFPCRFGFLSTLLLCEAKKGMSANQLRRTIWGEHKGSYKTAWYLCHVLGPLWTGGEDMLYGTVEIDETYIGGRHHGRPTRSAHCKTNR